MGDGTKIDPVFLALQRFNRRQYDECIALCSELLANNPYDQVCVCGAWPPGAPPRLTPTLGVRCAGGVVPQVPRPDHGQLG